MTSARAATVQCTPGFGSATKRKFRERSILVGDVIEGPGEIDQQPGVTAEFFLCTYVRRTRSRLWDMTSLGLHRSTPTCGSFLRSQGGGPRIRAATSPKQRATLRNLNLPGCLKVESTVWKLRPSTNSAPIGSSRNQKHRRVQQHQENSQERYSRDDRECRKGPEIRIAGPKYEKKHQSPLSQNHATTSDRIPSDSGVPPASTNEWEDHLSYPGPPTPRSRCPGSTTISDMLPPTAEKSTKIPALGSVPSGSWDSAPR